MDSTIRRSKDDLQARRYIKPPTYVKIQNA